MFELACQISSCYAVLYFADVNLGTVISMQENPYPGPYMPSIEEEKVLVAATRRNVVSIFSGASKQHSLVSDNESLVSVRVRHFSSIEPDDASIKQEDGPGLILYYMFDDWVSSYRLVARREHKYGSRLDELVGFGNALSLSGP